MPRIPVLDHTLDLSGTERHRLTSLYAPPDFVKVASFETLNGPEDEELPETVFADPIRRLYRCHTKAATWMSALFYFDKRNEMPEVQRLQYGGFLKAAAGHYGIWPQVKDLWEKMAADEAAGESRLPDEVFALVWNDAEGTKHRSYPLRNAEEIKMASAWLEKHRDQFLFSDQNTIARKVVERAEYHGVPLDNSETMCKLAGYGHCPASDVEKICRQRADILRRSHPELSAQMFKVADAVIKAPPRARDVDVREKLAVQLDQLDRETKLTAFYGKGLARPADVLFGVTTKAAEDFLGGLVQLVTGTAYEKQALAKLSVERMQDWLGELAHEVMVVGVDTPDMEKLADILPTLPRNLAVKFDQFARQSKIEPILRDKEAAAPADRLTDEEILALQKLYKQAKAEVLAPN